MGVEFRVRSRLANGELGEEARVKIRTSSDVAKALRKGLKIPIVLDRSTGLATEIPKEELLRELEPRGHAEGFRLGHPSAGFV